MVVMGLFCTLYSTLWTCDSMRRTGAMVAFCNAHHLLSSQCRWWWWPLPRTTLWALVRRSNTLGPLFQPCRLACDSRDNMISNALTGLTRHHYQPFRGRSLFGDSWIGCELFSSRHLSHLTWVHKQLCGFPLNSWLGMSPWDRGSFMAREWL